MVDIVLFNNDSTLRVADRALRFFSGVDIVTTEDTIWVKGLYLRFYPEFISVNLYNPLFFSHEKMFECLQYILEGEEAYLDTNTNRKKYFKCISRETDIASLFAC